MVQLIHKTMPASKQTHANLIQPEANDATVSVTPVSRRNCTMPTVWLMNVVANSTTTENVAVTCHKSIPSTCSGQD
jgi:hypothetical protein